MLGFISSTNRASHGIDSLENVPSVRNVCPALPLNKRIETYSNSFVEIITKHLFPLFLQIIWALSVISGDKIN